MRALEDALGPRLAIGRRGGGLRGGGRSRRALTWRNGHSALDALQPLQQSGFRVGCGRQQHPRAEQFEQQPGRSRAAHLGKSGVDDLGEPGQRCRAQLFGLALHLGELVTGGLDQSALRSVRHRVEQHEVAQPVEQVGSEPAGIVPGFHEPVDRAVNGGTVTGRERIDHVVDQRDVGDPEQRHRALVGDALGVRPGEQLVKHA